MNHISSGMVGVVLSNAKSSKLLDWYCTAPPQGWSVEVVTLHPEGEESDLEITVLTPQGEYSRVYTVAEQLVDAQSM
jgi:hypothetical protein